MRRYVLIFVALLLMVMPVHAQQSDAKFSKLAEQYMYESLALSPVSASYAGYHKHKDPKTGQILELDAMLDDVSPQGWATQVAFYQAWQKRFRTEVNPEQLSVEDKADWRL